ncbi:DNA cytosine methyltransferase [Prevotella sp. PINT]|jgi:DNA-methyltransferase (dcm)|uniref:DNA cytosine methyltransferase n=1 Tax=Bacteroidales TaxID=171549 RepID=UPI001552B8B7|nr:MULTISPECIES: DNA cytosine methyltransferase [Bacteroidales]NPD83022.1 DNA cytosine methyltransferase [Palleniella intestinalis]
MAKKKIRVIDCFAGCGGLSLGFQNAGFEIAAAYDFWDEAISIYKRNFEHPIYKRDLNDIEDLSDMISLKPMVIIGGPPCQDYSSAGRRDENLGRAQLTIKYAEIVTRIKPCYFLMENVPNIQKSEKLEIVLSMFKAAGYGISRMVIDASKCGVPQKRKRYIVIGGLNEEDGFLDSLLLKGQSKKSMTLRDYFGDSLGFEHYFRVPRSYSRRGIFSIDEPSMTIRGVDRPVPSGYPGHPNDPIPLNPSIRSLTPQERSWIQTFPRDFDWGDGSKTNLNLAIGNAVPVKLAEYLARCLKKHINEK